MNEEANDRQSTSRRGLRQRAQEWWERFWKAVVGVAVLLGAAAAYLALANQFGLPPVDGTPDVSIDIASSRLNPEGDDNPSEEYVCLVNGEDEPVELLGWQLRDIQGLVNLLPEFTLDPGETVRVHPGEGDNFGHDLFGAEGGQWNNDNEEVTLLDADGEEVDSQAAGPREESDGGGCGSEA